MHVRRKRGPKPKPKPPRVRVRVPVLKVDAREPVADAVKRQKCPIRWPKPKPLRASVHASVSGSPEVDQQVPVPEGSRHVTSRKRQSATGVSPKPSKKSLTRSRRASKKPEYHGTALADTKAEVKAILENRVKKHEYGRREMSLPGYSKKDVGIVHDLKRWIRRPDENHDLLKSFIKMQHPEFEFSWENKQEGAWDGVHNKTLMSLYLGFKNSVTHVFKSTCGVCGSNATDTDRTYLKSEDGTHHYMLNRMFPNLGEPEATQTFSVCSGCLSKSTAFTDSSPHGCPDTEDVTTPEQLALVKNPLHEQMLALGRIYSCVYKHTDPRRVQFQHMQGDLQYSKHLDTYFQGMLGAISVPDASQIVKMPCTVVNAVKWLRTNNIVFQQFASIAETLWPWLQGTSQFPNGADIAIGDGTVASQMGQEYEALIEPDFSQESAPPLTSNHHTVGRTFPRDAHDGSLEKATKLSFSDPLFDAKAFPKLFPYGRGGHDYKLKRALTLPAWQKKKLLHRSNVFRKNKMFIFVQLDKKTKTRLFSTNRYFLSNRTKTAVEAPEPSAQDSADQNKTPYGTELPPNLPGTAAYWSSCTGDVIALSDSQFLGQPDSFTTLTQNDLWPEIGMSSGNIPGFCPEHASDIHPTEPTEAVNNPIEVTLAYNKRWLEFKRNFLHNPNGPFGAVKHYWFRHEYQKRGAIHTHLVIWLKHRDTIESLISAHVPDATAPVTELGRKLVQRYQIHERCLKERCFKGVGGRKLKSCKYGFPFKTPHYQCCLDETKVRYLYPRYNADDAYVVPYNLDLLLFWQGHINMQKVTANGWQLYLAKYVAKSEPRLRLRTTFQHEVDKYLTTKITGVLEASQRLLSISLHGCTVDKLYLQDEIIPTYRFIKRDHPKNVKPTENDFYKTKFQKYLKRPTALSKLTYADFYQYFNFAGATETRAENDQDDLLDEPSDSSAPEIFEGEYWNATTEASRNVIAKFRPGTVIGGDCELKVSRRSRPVVTRFRYSSPNMNEGEPYYQQLLLRKVPFHGEENFFSPDNKSLTFLEECIIRDLVTSDTIQETMDRAVSRGLSYENIVEIGEMCRRSFPELSDAVGESLAQVKELYQQSNFAYTTEDTEEAPEFFPSPGSEDTVELTAEQRKICDEVVTSVTTGKEACLMSLLGPAGTGKSVIIRKIHSALSANNINVSVLAPTGTAACNINGDTVHHYFGLGIDNRSKIERDTVEFWRAHLLDLIIIDEISMLNQELLNVISEVLKQFNKRNQRFRVFGAVSILLVGDPAQLPPVSKDGKNHSVFQSKYWPRFKIRHLRDVLRQSDPAFQNALMHLRHGSCPPDIVELLTTRVTTVEKIELDIASFVPIICPRIETTEEWNTRYLELLEDSGQNFDARDFNPEGLPMSEIDKERIRRWCNDRLPDKLTIKKGCKVMLLRNMDVKNGWHNGALATVLEHSQRIITIQSLKTGRILQVPRYRNSYKIFNSPTLGYREQFPLQVAYAVTIHKFQGQTLESVIVDLRHPCWEAGQCYTALSRVKTLQGLTIIGDFALSVMTEQWVLDLLEKPPDGVMPIILTKEKKRNKPKTKAKVTSVSAVHEEAALTTRLNLPAPGDHQPTVDRTTGINYPGSNMFADNLWWKQNLQLSMTDKAECLGNAGLSTSVVDAAIFLLRKKNRARQLAGKHLLTGLDYISSLQIDDYQSNFHSGSEALQIMFVNGGHYQVLHRKHDRLYVYDSLSQSTTDAQNLTNIRSYIRQIKVPLGQLIYLPVQQQTMPDCACFATAFALSIVADENPCDKIFNRHQLRPHFTRCLETERLEPFPILPHDDEPRTPYRCQKLT